jgi:methionine synthase II (cobalamin-independent)
MQRSENIADLIGALAKAQAEFTYAAKGSKNPAFNSSYADLASVIEAVRPALSKHGIAFMQFDEVDLERQVASVTTSLHTGEQWISVTAEAPATGLKGFNVQSIGACWTYLRRYTLQAICGLASDDDDGNSLAVDNKAVPKKQAAPKQEQVPATVAAPSPESAPESDVRATFLAKAKELGWGLADVKRYLDKLIPGARGTAQFSEKQLQDTLEAFSQVKPAEFFTDDTTAA